MQNEVAAKLELILTGRKGGPLLSLAQMRDRLSEAIKPAVALRRNFADEENKTHDGVTLMQDRGMNSEEGEITLASAASSALHRPDFRDHDHDHDHDDHRPLRRTRRNSNEDWDDAELDAWLRDGEDTDPALCCGGCCTLLAFLAALFCKFANTFTLPDRMLASLVCKFTPFVELGYLQHFRLVWHRKAFL